MPCPFLGSFKQPGPIERGAWLCVAFLALVEIPAAGGAAAGGLRPPARCRAAPGSGPVQGPGPKAPAPERRRPPPGLPGGSPGGRRRFAGPEGPQNQRRGGGLGPRPCVVGAARPRRPPSRKESLPFSAAYCAQRTEPAAPDERRAGIVRWKSAEVFPLVFPRFFQKRARVWGRSPQRGPGAEPLAGPGAEPRKKGKKRHKAAFSCFARGQRAL